MTSTELARVDTSLDSKVRYAETLASSGLLPVAYRKQPANVLYAIEYGDMLGLPPLAAITGIHVIEGKPTASAGLISALVRRAGHRLRITGDGTRAVAEIVRSDDPDFTYRAEWTIERARAAELTGKGTWKKYPAAMLKARAITEVARDACEEALSGVHYTPEELGAEVNAEGEPITARAERVEQPTPAAAPPPPPRTSHAPDEQIEWDVLLTRAEGDRDELAKLWELARAFEPNNLPLLERLAAAGKAAKDAAEQVDQVDAEPIDGEVVEDGATS